MQPSCYMRTFYVSEANVTDLTYTMIDTLMRLEDEHGKESLDELTSDHFKGIIGDIFFGMWRPLAVTRSR